MIESLSNSLNNIEQVLSTKKVASEVTENKSSGIDCMTQDFKKVLEKTIDKTSKAEEKVLTISDLKSGVEDLDTESLTENWTEFKDILTQITDEANVESSLDLTLARDINEIIAQLKEAVENITGTIEQDSSSKLESEDENNDSESVQDLAGILLSVLENPPQKDFQDAELLNEEQKNLTEEIQVSFEQIVTFTDEISNTKTEIETLNQETDLMSLPDDLTLDSEEIIDYTNNLVDEVVADKTTKDATNLEIDNLLDDESIKDLKIESIQSEAKEFSGESLMQNQTPEEHSVKVMINEEIEVFDLKLESAQNIQTSQNIQIKPAEANPSRILEQITKHLEGLQQNSKVNIVLNPESLGKVNIQLLSTKEGLTAQFTVTTQEARDLLMKGLDGLKESLATHGVGVDNVSVKLADVQKSEYQQDWTEQEGSRGGNKGQGQPNREEKEKGLFEKMMAQTTEEENGNV